MSNSKKGKVGSHVHGRRGEATRAYFNLRGALSCDSAAAVACAPHKRNDYVICPLIFPRPPASENNTSCTEQEALVSGSPSSAAITKHALLPGSGSGAASQGLFIHCICTTIIMLSSQEGEMGERRGMKKERGKEGKTRESGGLIREQPSSFLPESQL